MSNETVNETSAAAFISTVLSPSGALWRTWFDRVGAVATVDVINATAELVIGERQIALAQRTEVIERALDPTIDPRNSDPE